MIKRAVQSSINGDRKRALKRVSGNGVKNAAQVGKSAVQCGKGVARGGKDRAAELAVRSGKRPDRRVLKTKRAIHKAMAKLLSEKDINEISVKEIAELADINRKTFYNHYDGVQQLLEDIESEIADRFAELLEATDFLDAIQEPSRLFDRFYSIISHDLDFDGVLLKMKKNVMLANKVINKLIAIATAAASEHLRKDPEKVEVVVRFIFAGEMAVYQKWFNSEGSMSVQELSGIINTLCIKGIDGLLAD